MTDTERIADLERRVEQLEDILEKLTTGCDDGLWCKIRSKDRDIKTSLYDYIHYHCKFGKREENKQ